MLLAWAIPRVESLKSALRQAHGGVSVMLDEQATGVLAQSFRGNLIQPGDADYDEARKLYNGMIDKRPRLIARCADVADVIAAVNFGRDQNLLVAIRGGGHNGRAWGAATMDW